MKALPVMTAAGLLALAAAGIGTTLPVTPSLAQPAAPGASTAAPAPERQERMREMRMPSRHIEGRLAFLHTELKITDAQKPQWDRLAQVMRDNAKAMDQLVEQRRGGGDRDASAADRLDQRARFAEVRAASAKSFAEAFRPLYDSFSDEQKKTANDLFAQRHHRGMRH